MAIILDYYNSYGEHWPNSYHILGDITYHASSSHNPEKIFFVHVYIYRDLQHRIEIKKSNVDHYGSFGIDRQYHEILLGNHIINNINIFQYLYSHIKNMPLYVDKNNVFRGIDHLEDVAL